MDPSASDEAIAAEGSTGDNQDPLITAKLAEILAQAPVLFDRLTATSRAGAQAGSEAAQDESSPLGHHVRIMAIDHLTTGIDHLVMWQGPKNQARYRMGPKYQASKPGNSQAK